MSQSGDTPARWYRHKWFPQLVMLVAALNRLLWLGVVVALMGLLVVVFNHFISEGIPPFTLFLLCPTLVVPIALVAILVYGLVASAGRAFLSYVEVTPDGLEVRRWPSYRVFCCWKDTERMGGAATRGYHTLRLHNAEQVDDDTLAMTLRRLANRVRQVSPADTLSLRSIRGYPEGDFTDDLRRYAPHLFEAESGS